MVKQKNKVFLCPFCNKGGFVEVKKHEIKLLKCTACGKETPVIEECNGDECKL